MEIINVEARTLASPSSFAPRQFEQVRLLSVCRRFEAMMARFEAFAQNVETLCRNNGDKGMQKWLDNQDVCQILNISKRTLQTYRDNGTLPYSQINHKMFYRAEDVERVINQLKNK